LVDPEPLSASEVLDEADDGLDSSELSRRCQISRKVDKQKWENQSGSFILQDLMTNTLYLVAQLSDKEVCFEI
jgi:hypothetical protein